MQNTRGEWQAAVRRLYNRKNFINYDLGVKAIHELGYTRDLRSLTILDAYPGAGVFSAALYNTLRPEKHVILEPIQPYYKFLSSLECPGLHVSPLDPYRWGTFTSLIDQGIIVPHKQPQSHPHNQLLYAANLTHSQGEQLAAQYLNCITNRSWLLEYGRVRLLFWLRSDVAAKFLSGPGEPGRHRISVQRESCCDARVVFHLPPESPKKSLPARLENAMFRLTSSDIAAHSTVPVALVEFTPKAEQIAHLDEFEYVTRMLFVMRSTPLEKSLDTLGPGACEALAEPLADLLDKVPARLTLEEIERVVAAFVKWPFRPDFLHSFYEEHLLGTGNLDD